MYDLRYVFMVQEIYPRKVRCYVFVITNNRQLILNCVVSTSFTFDMSLKVFNDSHVFYPSAVGITITDIV